MQFHLDMSAQRNISRGMSPDFARRNAKLAFGGAEAVREAAREAHRSRFAENVVSDIRYALRGLRRSPSFAAAAILTVALGIGASTAIFSVVNAVMLRPLPIPHPEDFAYIGWVWKKGDDIPSLSAFQYEYFRDHNRSFEAVAAYGTQESSLGDETAPPIRGLRVTGGFFRTLGFAPRLGRDFDASELEAGGPAVVILGDEIWRTRFGGDAGIVGKQIRLDGGSHTVIGVMPPSFQFPPRPDNRGFIVPLPIHADPADEGHNTEAIGRLRHGVPAAARNADLELLSTAFHDTYPGLSAAGEKFKLFSHQDVNVGTSTRRTLWILFGAVLLVLMIACANTATLLLVRASVRQREIAVRASIGAGPGRIIQQLLVEGLVLSVLAAALGVGIGTLALRSFLVAAPSALPTGFYPGIDTRVLVFAIVVSLGSGLVFGLAAAAPSLRSRLHTVLLASSRSATGGGTRTREMLVFLETTAAVVLLAGATLLTASFARLISVNPGFDADHVLAVRLGRLPRDYNAARVNQLVDRLLDRIRALPGVQFVAAAPNLPLERGMNFPVDTREHPELGLGAIELRFVSPDYFAVLGERLVQGRDFNASDVAGSEPVAIVNESFARRFFSGESAPGGTIQIGHFKDRWLNPAMEHETRVIAVAADMHELGLDQPARPTVLLPRAQAGDGTPVLLVRAAPPTIAGILPDEITAEEPQLKPVVEPLSAVVRRSVAAPRFRTMIIGAFAGSALLLAAIGIYGVIASVVQQRTREIGLRLALGASRTDVAVDVVRRCLASVVGGAIAGLAVFWALRRALAGMLFQTSAGDPRVLAIAIAVLAMVAALAAWIPARRATRVDPAASLRLE